MLAIVIMPDFTEEAIGTLPAQTHTGMMAIFYNHTGLIGYQEPRVAIEDLKCYRCDKGAEFYILCHLN